MSDLAICTLLDWDSAFFGFRIARVCGDTLTQDDLQSVDLWCTANSVDCLYFLARSDESSVFRVAQQGGFKLVDVRLTYARDLMSGTTVSDRANAVDVRPARDSDLPVLQGIARNSHTQSRFFADERFSRELCHALYETWIVQSCNGYANMVFVAEFGRMPIGYLSCHLDAANEKGTIGLVAVESNARGLGAGQAMVGQALKWFTAEAVRTVSVVTQGNNIAAQRLYQRNGFLTESVQLWFHKWY